MSFYYLYYQIDNTDVARCLGLEVGRYKFEDRVRRNDRPKISAANVQLRVTASSEDPCNRCAESSTDDISVLNVSSYSNVENLSAEPLELSTIDTDAEPKHDLPRTIDSDLDALQYVLNNDGDDRSVNDTSSREDKEQVVSSFDSVQYRSFAAADNVFDTVNAKSELLAVADNCQDDLGNMSNAAAEICIKLESVTRSLNDNVPSELELLADSFVTTNGIVFCSDLGSSSSCTKASDMDGSCNRDEMVTDFHKHEDASKSMLNNVNTDEPVENMLNDVNADEPVESSLPLDVEALFASSVCSRT